MITKEKTPAERVQEALDELAAGTTTEEAAADVVAQRLLDLGYRGRPYHGCACPVARYLIDRVGTDLRVGVLGVFVDAQRLVELPPSVAWFVLAFDDGHYPALLPRLTRWRQKLFGRSPRWDA